MEYISFGSESGDIKKLTEIAALLADEQESYKSILRENLDNSSPKRMGRTQAALDPIRENGYAKPAGVSGDHQRDDQQPFTRQPEQNGAPALRPRPNAQNDRCCVPSRFSGRRTAGIEDNRAPGYGPAGALSEAGKSRRSRPDPAVSLDRKSVV